MLLATWNVNSVRARIDRVAAWLQQHQIDVLAIQETKCKDTQFPEERFTVLGYEVAHWGFNQWNGVAIVSKIGLTDVVRGFPEQPGFDKSSDHFNHPPEARAIGATCGSLRIWSLYIPNGREISDPHYSYKLSWLDNLRTAMCTEVQQYPKLVLCGDWNIAPHDDDVWDIEEFKDKTHITSAERSRFEQFLKDGFVEPVRQFTPGEFTYWDYTQLRFQKKEGMRIDFALVSTHLASKVNKGMIDREERKGKGASDHAPVILSIEE